MTVPSAVQTDGTGKLDVTAGFTAPGPICPGHRP